MRDALVRRLDVDATTERAIVGYTAAVAFGAYALAVAAVGDTTTAVAIGLVAVLGASLGRYYHTAERV